MDVQPYENTLNPTRAIYSVIGNLCENPQQIRDPEIFLSKNDFAQDLHKIIFSAIYNLAYENGDTKKITEIDIDNYLAPFPKLYQIWEKQNGLKYVRDSITHSNQSTFKSNYELLKKFSLLRHYKDNGIDISEVYDYKTVDISVIGQSMKKLQSMSIDDIIEFFTIKMINIRETFETGKESRDFKAGDDAATLLERLTQSPEYGYPFKNTLYNAIFRGMRPGKFLLRSAGTGTGKTRQAIMDMCSCSFDEIFNLQTGKWESNGPAIPTLYISTELEQEEVQTIILAYISGVDEYVIKDGRYAKPIHDRLSYAIKLMEKAPLYCVYIDDFSISDIEMIIERNIIEYNIKMVAFDYIQITPKLSRTIALSFGSNLREDQILAQFSRALKIMATKYLVFIESSTQLNRSSKDNNMRDTSSLRGGSATADKIDHGVQTYKVSGDDISNLKHILEKGFYKKPNYSHWVYKNRSGASDCIIWTYMNMGNMREEPLFVTDFDFNILNIDPVDIDLSTVSESMIDNSRPNVEPGIEETAPDETEVEEETIDF